MISSILKNAFGSNHNSDSTDSDKLLELMRLYIHILTLVATAARVFRGFDNAAKGSSTTSLTALSGALFCDDSLTPAGRAFIKRKLEESADRHSTRNEIESVLEVLKSHEPCDVESTPSDERVNEFRRLICDVCNSGLITDNWLKRFMMNLAETKNNSNGEMPTVSEVLAELAINFNEVSSVSDWMQDLRSASENDQTVVEAVCKLYPALTNASVNKSLIADIHDTDPNGDAHKYIETALTAITTALTTELSRCTGEIFSLQDAPADVRAALVPHIIACIKTIGVSITLTCLTVWSAERTVSIAQRGQLMSDEETQYMANQ